MKKVQEEKNTCDLNCHATLTSCGQVTCTTTRPICRKTFAQCFLYRLIVYCSLADVVQSYRGVFVFSVFTRLHTDRKVSEGERRIQEIWQQHRNTGAVST